MKLRMIFFITGLAVIVSLYGCGIMSKKYTKTESVTHQISTDGKKKIKLENINGSVAISQSKDSNVLIVKAYKEIKVKKKYLDTPFDEIEVILDTTGNMISIKTEINKDGEDGIFKFNMDRKQRVDYEISVPLNMKIEIENINGNVSAGSLSDDLKIDLVNGEISLENYTGRLECEVTNGSFSGHIESTKGIDINTINGGVTLYLNNYMNANVRAESLHGKITNEQLQFREMIKEKNLFKGKLGSDDSEVDIKIETVNGKIKLYGRNEI
ncbi:MAG: hypothetical protein M3R36_07820 [Bacteroidota bacterium]|nr:hypothetical protein [Bacteroidota bacterium]